MKLSELKEGERFHELNDKGYYDEFGEVPRFVPPRTYMLKKFFYNFAHCLDVSGPSLYKFSLDMEVRKLNAIQ